MIHEDAITIYEEEFYEVILEDVFDLLLIWFLLTYFL
jgi:hypothetical protein